MKVKKWLLGFATFAAMVVICAVCAGAETFGDFEYEVTYDDRVTITNYNGSAENVDIPAEIDGMSVKSIDYYAFNGCTNLTDITIPDSVTEIYGQAFYNCTSLKKVTIPASVISIGEDAFGYYEEYYGDIGEKKKVDGFKINYVKNSWGHRYATKNGFSEEVCLITNELNDGSLEIDGYAGNSPTYIIPGEIDGKKVTEIGGYAFDGCTELTSITIPDSVTDIGTGAFYNCTSLKSVTIPTSVTSIGIETFGYYKGYDADTDSWKSKKVDGFEINYVKNTRGHWYAIKNGFSDGACLIVSERDDGTLKIDGYAGNSTSYIIPAEIDGKKVTVIGDYAFMDCNELTYVTIPDSVISIGDYAFYNCASLETITIPDSVTSIDSFAFSYCTSLKSVTIPASVTSINWQAFYNCISLKEVTIPASVTDIGNEAFGYYYDTETYTSKKVDGFKINYIKNTWGHWYATKNGFSNEICLITNELYDGTLGIERYAGNVSEYVIPSELNGKKITEIYSFAFSYCTELTSITIPGSIKSICNDAFVNCTSLKEVDIPANVTSIGSNAFGYYYTDLWEIEKVDCFKINYVKNTWGHWYATKNGFSDETCLVVNELEDGTLKIDGYAGNNATYDIPDEIDGKKVTEIYSNAFIGNTKLTSVTIPDSVKSIANTAFYGCTSLEEVTIPASMRYIDFEAFVNCISLKSVTIPANVKRVDDAAFGYYYDKETRELTKVEDFKIYCYGGTAGEQYAKDNGLAYELLKCTEHKYGDWTITKDATCTEIGTKVHICTVCGGEETVNIPAKGHTEVIDKAVDATCTKTGLTEGSHCSVCNTVIKAQEVVPAKGHTEVIDKAVAATCTKTGFTEGSHCSVCNTVIKAQEVVPAKGHTEVIDKAVDATCTKTGLTEGSHCSVCNAVIKAQKVVPAKGHTEVIDKAVAATCTKTGLTEGSHCSVCNAVIKAQKVVPAKGHTEVIDKAVAATCTKTGFTEGSHCSVCNTVIKAQEVVPAKGHVKVVDKAVEATCTKTGLTEGSHCSVCDAVIKAQEVVPAKGHKEVVDKAVEATCTKTGLTEGSHCSVCDAVIKAQEVVPAKGHKEVVDKAVEATCTKTGLTEGSHCSVCNTVIKAQEVVPAKGHKEVVDKAVAATCTKTGLTEGKHCSVCNAVIKAQEVVPAKDHQYTKTVVAPTYTSTGYTLYKCSVCGYSYKDNETAKLTLAKVTGFKVKSLTSTNVTLQWNKNANASGYEIEQYKSGKWVNVAKITSNATTSYTVKGLAAGTAGYKFRMRAVNGGAYSDYTPEVTVNTNPYGVGGFKCSSKSSTSVTLKWNKGTTASGYQLQQYKDGKWVTIYTGTKATDTSYTVKKLKAGTAGYRFRIRAYKTYGNTKQYGSWSSEVKVNTNPYGVGGFKCSSKSSTSVTLKWNKGTTASGYQLQQYKNGKWVTIYTGTKATNTSYTVKGLKAGTAGYRFRIRAYKTYGNTKQYGSWSSEVKVNTNPYGVGGFKAKSTAKNSITLGWNKGTTASGYQLQQYKGGKWVTVYTGTKATSTSCTIKSLKANTSYKFRIRAYKTYGNTKQYGSWSKELTVKTKK